MLYILQIFSRFDDYLVVDFTPVVLFFGLLPLANAPLDWLSLGLTRGLLAYGQAVGGAWRIILIYCVDVAAAFALTFPLAVLTTTVVALANWASVTGGGEPVIPLAALFEGLRNDPGDPRFYWITFMLFSTLLPSVLHILTGLVGLVLTGLLWVLWTPSLAQALVASEADKEVTKDTKLTVLYPALAATGVTLIFALLYGLYLAIPGLPRLAGLLGQALLATAEGTAALFPA